LEVRFDESVNLAKREESRQCDATHVHQKHSVLLTDANELVEEADLHEALVRQNVEVLITSDIGANFRHFDLDIKVNIFERLIEILKFLSREAITVRLHLLQLLFCLAQ